MIFFALTFFLSLFAAPGDKLVGVWKGAGKVDEYPLTWNQDVRQRFYDCKSLELTIAIANNSFKYDLKYQCGTNLPTGTFSLGYKIQKGTNDYRNLLDPDGAQILGRAYTNFLDTVEMISYPEDNLYQVVGNHLLWKNAKTLQLRLQYLEHTTSDPADLFQRTFTATNLKKN